VETIKSVKHLWWDRMHTRTRCESQDRSKPMFVLDSNAVMDVSQLGPNDIGCPSCKNAPAAQTYAR
jgi:hypothetical protein